VIAFVTGSTGLIGTSLVRLLVEKGHEVRALARDRRKSAEAFAGLDVEVVEATSPRGRFAAPHQLRRALHAAAYFAVYYRPGVTAERSG
jgi:dihydroflavonol-4-reductase